MRAALVTVSLLVIACSDSSGPAAPGPAGDTAQSLVFTPLFSSAMCTDGGDPAAPLALPPELAQRIIASEPDFPDLPDMQTLNETGLPVAADV